MQRGMNQARGSQSAAASTACGCRGGCQASHCKLPQYASIPAICSTKVQGFPIWSGRSPARAPAQAGSPWARRRARAGAARACRCFWQTQAAPAHPWCPPVLDPPQLSLHPPRHQPVLGVLQTAVQRFSLSAGCVRNVPVNVACYAVIQHEGRAWGQGAPITRHADGCSRNQGLVAGEEQSSHYLLE